MKVLRNHYKLIIFVAFVAVGAFAFLPKIIPTQDVSAACCPGESGCSDTCQGCRVNPAGGPGCYTNSEGCTSCSPPPPPNPPCVQGSPGAFSLAAPVNGAVNLDNPITFVWSDGAGWGNNCGGANTYTLLTAPLTGAVCPAFGAAYTAKAVTTPGVTSAVVSDLSWGKSYCWYVHKSNSVNAVNAGPAVFTTALLPTVSNVKVINATKCNNTQVSGRTTDVSGAAQTDVNNPITLQMDISSPYNNFSLGINKLNNVRVAIVPDVTHNASTVVAAALEPTLPSVVSGTNTLPSNLGFKVAPVSPVGAMYSAATSTASPYFTTASASGELSMNGNAALNGAKLLSLNSATNVQQIDNTTMRVTWNIEFANVFGGLTAAQKATLASQYDNVYVAAIAQTPGGTLVSQSATGVGVNAIVYAKAMDWQTDLLSPTADITQPVALGTDTFKLNWNVSDAGGLKDVRSYCYVDSNTQSLVDQTLGQTISLNSTPLAYDKAGNCLITAGNAGTHIYTLNSLASTSDLRFGLYAKDNACNTTEDTGKLDSPAAWILTSHGTVSAGGGYTNFIIKNIATLNGIVPNLGADAFLSTYSAISGNNFLVNQFQSKNNYYVTGYNDKGLLPPEISGSTNWFEYLYQMASFRQTIDTVTLPSISGNFSAAFSAGAGSSIYKYVNNDLIINSGSKCDLNGAIFVNGNLTIEPDLTKTSNSVGCVFIVKGSITIDSGASKTPAATNTSTPSQYDVVEGSFITDNTFATTDDRLAGGKSSWSIGQFGGTARHIASAVSTGGKMYVWGGYTGAANANNLFIYDSVTNSWSTGAVGGTPRYRHTAVVYNGKMYVWGGYNVTTGKLNSMDIYDIASNTWSAGPAGLGARFGHAAAVYNGKMYVWGGDPGTGVASNKMDVFDFATSKWSVGTAGGTAAINTAGVVVGDNFYVISGSGITGMSIYNFTTDTWTAGPTLDIAHSFHTVVTYNNLIYVWAGYTSPPTAVSNRVDIYNPSTRVWTFGVSGGTARVGQVGAVINNKFYGWGGVNSATTYLNTMDVYDFGTLYAGDALYIHGTVYSGKLSLLRNLGIAQNSLQPAEVFDYDPVYARIYRNLLGIRNFSLRAQ